MMNKVFIGGSRRITKLNKDITNRIDNIMQNGYTILIGDANGVDKSVQKYLQDKNYRNVVVYCMGSKCRNNIANWESKHIAEVKNKKDFNYYAIKDLEMSKETNYGFMIWDGKSKGTLNNIMNLIKEDKKVLVYFYPDKFFCKVDSSDDLRGLLSRCDKSLLQMFKKEIGVSCDDEEVMQKGKQVVMSFN